MVPKIKYSPYQRNRFAPTDLDHILDLLERNTIKLEHFEDAEFCSVSNACFIYRLTTAQITRLLITGLLPSSIRLPDIPGFNGIRLKRNELLHAMKVFTDDHIDRAKWLGIWA